MLAFFFNSISTLIFSMLFHVCSFAETSRSKEEINSNMKQLSPLLQKCLIENNKTTQNIQTQVKKIIKLKFEFFISPEGTISEEKILNSDIELLDKEFHKCALEQLTQLKFPQHESAMKMKIIYPITIIKK